MTTRLTPYIVLNGNAREAISFYEKALEAEVLGIMPFGDHPNLPPEAKDMIMHAMLQVGESHLMFSDTFPGQEHTVGNQVTIALMTNSAEKSTQYFNALQDGGHVIMPLQATDWSPAYGMVVDKFGVTFQVNTEMAEQQ